MRMSPFISMLLIVGLGVNAVGEENPACVPQERKETAGHCAGLRNLAQAGNIDF